ncbi:YwqI/YxiC family protein [Peribacillus sp. SCS-37]|uniref:YwqI/YxiC family protein n=1 Tax=Paraperibacillus esterisolvens TaxID=3115296 RepID=UPI003906B008
MEIKMNYSSIERALQAMQGASSSLEPSLPKSIGGANELDAVTTLVEVNELFTQILENYKALLIKNEQMTRKSVETMKQTDHELSASFGPVPLR